MTDPVNEVVTIVHVVACLRLTGENLCEVVRRVIGEMDDGDQRDALRAAVDAFRKGMAKARALAS